MTQSMDPQPELTAAEKIHNIINAIPGGIAIYRVSDIFETTYFSDGVPELTGYTVEEYRELVKQDAANMTYWEDTEMVVSKAMEAIRSRQVSTFEFRKQHRDGHIVWVRVQMKYIGEERGRPLLHCVFHNITDLKEAQLEMDHLINSIPGGIASYRVENDRFIPLFYSDGVPALTGHTREEFQDIPGGDALNVIYEVDRPRVLAAARAALESGEVLDVSYRMRHKNGELVWLHLNGRRMGPRSESMRFYAVFTGMSNETRLFQSIANETADGIYVVDQENYDLLYANESRELRRNGPVTIGRKCYAALHGRDTPCDFCVLENCKSVQEDREILVEDGGRIYATRVRQTEWNGIAAYVKYIRDVTEEIQTQREKERLDQYFQTMVNNLAGGVAVIREEHGRHPVPEFLSDGFAAMTGMTPEETWELYRENAMAGVHPDDLERVRGEMTNFISGGRDRSELVYRLKKGVGGYLWVKNTLSLMRLEGGVTRIYASYHDMTQEREEQARLRRQYNELIIQHYRSSGPNALIAGHCNITRNQLMEVMDYTDSGLARPLGTPREEFFTEISELVPDAAQRQAFLDTYLNAPTLAAYERGEHELLLTCFIKLPRDEYGRYAQFKVLLVETPDTGDVTGILTVTDVTESTLSERILYQLSVASYDLVSDVDLYRDRYTVLTGQGTGTDAPNWQGSHSQRLRHILEDQILPKDRAQTAMLLDQNYMLRRLKEQGAYSLSYSMITDTGDLRTKNLTVSAVDLRLGRVCLARADITDSLREQQGLLNAMAYTFDLLCFLDVDNDSLIMYTRDTVLENLPPLTSARYSAALDRLVEHYAPGQEREQVKHHFRTETILALLNRNPSGYDFVLPHQGGDGLRYKQINVMWGDQSHRTVCLVRADVTDILAAERQSKEALEKALSLAEEANRAKSDFLSSMSHDIRTPMNAIMGMTALAVAHLDDRRRVEDYLQKISLSSTHLLSLINDILDMSKIERSMITLNRVNTQMPDILSQLTAMLAPQAKSAGLEFHVRSEGITHPDFYGDALRINQILINLVGNAIKFTPEGGTVDCLAEELTPRGGPAHVRYRFTVSDTGVGMTDEFMTHIFEPFTRSRGATRVEGSGLGLSITKGLVNLMDGEISVESTPRAGTTFRVELEFDVAPPREGDGTSRPAPTLSGPPTLLTGRRFLVAEDNAINAEILCELLSMYGAQSVLMPNGVETVEAFQTAPPGTYDAILMDIQMPVMNGYEATRAIRGLDRPDARTIPIVAMTANAFAEDVQASLDAGMTAHVAKPIDMQVLWAALAGLFGPA